MMRKGGNLLNFILNQISDLEGVTFQKTIEVIRFKKEEVTFARIQGGQFKLQATQSCGSNPEVEVDIQKNGQPVYLCTVPEPVLEDKSQLHAWIKKVLHIH
jgi:hypothetical protein